MIQLTDYERTAIVAILVARIAPYRIFSIIPVVYAFVSRPRVRSNPVDRRNYFLLSILFLIHNSLLAVLLCSAFKLQCLLRYVFLTPLIPLYFFQGKAARTTTPDTFFSPHSLVIRTLWDPPIMMTSYFLYKGLSIRLLHDGFHNFVTHVTPRLLISSFPFKNDVGMLYNTYNVRSVVNMCAEYKGPVHEYSKFQITHLRLPTVDGSVPRLDDAQKAVEFIDNRLNEQHQDTTVLVHCKGGRGRAASIIICFLLKHKMMQTPQDAFSHLKKKRPVLEVGILSYPIYDHFIAHDDQ